MSLRPFNPEIDRITFMKSRLFEFVGDDQFEQVTNILRFLEAYQNPGLFFVFDEELGGPGSGNWGHKGTPGERGGSLPRGAGFIPPKIWAESRKQPRVVAARDTVKVLRTSKILPAGPWFTPIEKGFVPPVRETAPTVRPIPVPPPTPSRKVAPVSRLKPIPPPPPPPPTREIAPIKTELKPKLGYIIGEGGVAQKVISSEEQPTFSGRVQVTHAEGKTLDAKASLESLLTNEVKAKLNEEYETLDWDDLFEEMKERPDDVLALVIGAALRVRESE